MTAANLSESSTQANVNPKFQPFEIGKHFVRQYYTILSREPSRLHCFYGKNSTMTIGHENESTAKAVYGIEEINKKLDEQKYEDYNICVSSLDVQSAANAGLFIMVVGDMIHKSSTVKRFAQTFLLNEEDKCYFVSNSVCRFLRDVEFSEEEEHHEEKKALEIKEEKKEAPKIEEKKKPDEKNVIEKKSEEKPSIPSIEKKIEVPAVKAVAPPPKAEEAVEPKGPQTWAKLAANQPEKWGNNASANVNVSSIPVSIVASEDVKTERKDKKDKADFKPRNVNVAASVYVRSLPENVTFQEVKQVFAKLGAVKFVEFNSAKTGAIVEFVNIEASRSAIGGEYVIRNETLIVEERKPKPTSYTNNIHGRRSPRDSAEPNVNRPEGARKKSNTSIPSGDQQPKSNKTD